MCQSSCTDGLLALARQLQHAASQTIGGAVKEQIPLAPHRHAYVRTVAALGGMLPMQIAVVGIDPDNPVHCEHHELRLPVDIDQGWEGVGEFVVVLLPHNRAIRLVNATMDAPSAPAGTMIVFLYGNGLIA